MRVKLTFTVPSILHRTGFVQCFIYFRREDLFYRASVSSFCIKPFPINISYQPSSRHETKIPAEKMRKINWKEQILWSFGPGHDDQLVVNTFHVCFGLSPPGLRLDILLLMIVKKTIKFLGRKRLNVAVKMFVKSSAKLEQLVNLSVT